MPLRSVLKYVSEMERLNVAETSRSPGGFLSVSGLLPEKWLKKRAAYLSRYIDQYNKKPTYRRYLGLVAWGYKPNKPPRNY